MCDCSLRNRLFLNAFLASVLTYHWLGRCPFLSSPFLSPGETFVGGARRLLGVGVGGETFCNWSNGRRCSVPTGHLNPNELWGTMVLQRGKRICLWGFFFFEKKVFWKNTNTQKQLFFVFALVVQVRSRVHFCFVKTGLVDRLDRPPGMMLDASTSSPDKSSMTSGFSESESTVFFFFCFLSFFCFFFGRSSSSSVLSASSCSSQSPRRSKVSLKVVGFSIIARLDTKILWREREREREIPISSSSSKRRLCFTKKQREQKDERTNARRFRNSSHLLLLLLLFFLDFFRKVPFGLRTLALQTRLPVFFEIFEEQFSKRKND